MLPGTIGGHGLGAHGCRFGHRIDAFPPGRKNRLTIELAGSAESVYFDQEQPETLWLGRRDGSALLMRDGGSLSEDAARLSVLPAGHPLGYQDAFNAFIADSYAAALGEVPEGLPTFEDGLRAARLTEAVMEAAASGNWVAVPGASAADASGARIGTAAR